eukprot:Cvel_27971.t1-p1 / transcript=Cvel_27971.t1 / gene=Cvel_27971 / organism=Chromera_velia_CCMP2878 / gene_product=hypothetical protein / transcript_product=hypothetical protein / location=Cvel_scaffold3574:15219-15602(+) / protein_length=128 / sequence_SO=supercontig / SO=protein_coding / is_pseudo=false
MIGQGASPVSFSLKERSPVMGVWRRMIFEGGAGADVELVAKDETRPESELPRIFGNKGILSARCPFFNAAFSGGFQEGGRSVFPISDTSFEALRCVVLHLHTDVTELEVDFALDVMELARRFELSWLQ